MQVYKLLQQVFEIIRCLLTAPMSHLYNFSFVSYAPLIQRTFRRVVLNNNNITMEMKTWTENKKKIYNRPQCTAVSRLLAVQQPTRRPQRREHDSLVKFYRIQTSATTVCLSWLINHYAHHITLHYIMHSFGFPSCFKILRRVCTVFLGHIVFRHQEFTVQFQPWSFFRCFSIRIIR